jgi:adenylate cyclase
MGGANFSSLPIVAIMQQQGDNNRQVSYQDRETSYFGAYYRIAGTDAVVITTIPHDIVFEAVRSITRQNIFLAVAVLFITIIFIWFFSKTISRPARILANAALQIEEGKFELELKPQTRDELGLLTESFDNMSRALNIFGRFTNKDMALRAMRGEIKPGGLPRNTTIFFSDIRGFTAKAENFTNVLGDDAADRLVLWLNDYFTHMIKCEKKTGGVVDKFVGDAVMAIWGAISTDGDKADAYNCIKAALMMRDALVEMNARRQKDDPGNPIINIGCGINTGRVIAGQIGSEQRMEYTVIGDPVNLASRIESYTKELGVDILISENTWKITGNKFITEEMPSVKLRGIEKPVRVFAVINFKNSKGPQTLAEVRKLLGIAAPDVTKRSRTEIEHTDTGGKPDASPVITMTSFNNEVWIQGPPGKTLPVLFSWEMTNGSYNTRVFIELAGDRDFNQILERRKISDAASVSIPLQNGLYWWRVYPVIGKGKKPANPVFPSGVLEVDAQKCFL